MKKDSILILAGIIPLFFLIYIFYVMGADHRNEDFNRAAILDGTTLSSLKVGESVRLSGTLSEKNPILLDSYILATREIKVKQKDRSVWETSESFLGPLILTLPDGTDVTVRIAPDYVPCGDGIRVVLPEKNAKQRTLGLEARKPLTGYGKLESLNPPIVDLGKSPCAENLDTYTGSLQKKFPSYVLAALFLAVPSLFLIYLGLYSKKTDT